MKYVGLNNHLDKISATEKKKQSSWEREAHW